MTDLLLSCPRAGLLRVHIDGNGLTFFNSHPTAVDVHTGLTPMGDNHFLWCFAGRELAVVDGAGVVHYRVPLSGDDDYHGVAVGDEGIYAVNTQRSCVERMNMDWEWDAALLMGEGLERLNDACHLNGVCADGGAIFSTAFSLPGSVDEAWRPNDKNGVLIEWDCNCNPNILLDGLYHPHTPWIERLNGLVCESMRGVVHLIRFSHPKERWEIEETWHLPTGYPRGLCVTDDGIFVGLSAYRGWHDDRAQLVLLSRQGEFKQSWLLPVKEVYDICEVRR